MKKRTIATALSIALSLAMGGAASAHSDSYGYFGDDSCSSSIGCTSEFVGDVIAFPFRLVANAVDFVF